MSRGAHEHGRTWPRIILHADMDAFFAAVEQLDDPALRGKPLLVGHPGKRSVVTTASYEARPYGVGSAMPMARARCMCPQAIVVPPRFSRYAEVSQRVFEVFASFSPLVEPLSLDEAFLDMTGAERLFGPPEVMGRLVRERVREATGGLTVSVGIAVTKFVAKVASDVRKPDGLTLVPAEATRAFLAPLPISRLWGVGPRTLPALQALGLRTIGDVARYDPSVLRARLGALGEHIARLAVGDDPREVVPERDSKSIGSEETLEEDISGEQAIKPHLLRAADHIARRLRRDGLEACGVRVKLKTFDFRIMTRQRRLPRPSSTADELYAAALELLPQFDLDVPVRLVGLAGFELVSSAAPRQQELFGGEERRRRAQLDKAMDAVRVRFGDAALRRASELAEGPDDE